MKPLVDLCPVANAVEAGAESVITELAIQVSTVPVIMLSTFNGSPLYHRARVSILWEQPSGTKTMTFFMPFLLLLLLPKEAESAGTANREVEMQTKTKVTRTIFEVFFTFFTVYPFDLNFFIQSGTV
jgi:hypothetical protein